MKKINWLLLAVLFTIPFRLIGQQPPSNSKFILIHVDGISTEHFLEEAKKGNLTNLTGFFGEKGRIEQTITYFPSKTPTVIASIRDGVTPDMAALAGWLRMDDGNGEIKGMVGTFLQMAFSKSRMATTNLIYGIPGLDYLAGFALQNIVTYLKDYDVLQFYWYKTDTHAHFYGEEAYRKQLREFDRQFGKLVKLLPEDVNIIIYSDHGLTFGEGIELDDAVKEIVGSDLLAFAYPTLYLDQKENREKYAKDLVEKSEIAVTFFQLDDHTVKGIHKDGEIFFRELDERVKYFYLGEDLLGYSDAGYEGEFLDKDEWLGLTHNSDYPMAPINIYYFMQNSSSGDIITLLGPGQYNKTGYSSKGNHGGFHRQDMTAPLFVYGSDVESLYNRSYFWLPELFSELDQFDFNAEPPRDRHYLASRYNTATGRMVTEFAFSPTYRIYYGVDHYWSTDLKTQRTDIWGKADIFRSYLSRIWIGGGVEVDENSAMTPFFKLRYDLHLRKFLLKNSYATNREFIFKISYEVRSFLAFELINFRSLGVRIDF